MTSALLILLLQGGVDGLIPSQSVIATDAMAQRKRRRKKRRRRRKRAKKKMVKTATPKPVVMPAPAPVAKPEPPKPEPVVDSRPGMAALDVVAVSGIEPAAARLINEAVLSRLKATERFSSVLGSSDLQAMLSMEQQKAVLGCADDGCLAELGGALGVPLLFSADVGKVGGRFMLNMKILRVDEASVAARLTLVYSSIDELIQELNQAVDALAAKVFGEAIPESVIARSSAPIELTAEQRSKRLRKFVVAGSTMLVGVGGAVAAKLYLDFEQQAFNGVVVHQSDDFQRLDQAQSVANWGLGIGVSVALVGGVLFW